MKSILTLPDLNNFWFRLYFKTSNKKEMQLAAINRAYRDFSRTLHGIGEFKSTQKYTILLNFMKEIINDVNCKKFSDQIDFDKWHKEKCDFLKEMFKEHAKYDLYYGQAQKWINMSLKYIFAIGLNLTLIFEENYEFFHIPIDDLIQDEIFLKYKISRIPQNWSRIDKYQDYLDYQIKFRNACLPEIPLDKEFKLYNISKN